jgi:twitching motility protein PilT
MSLDGVRLEELIALARDRGATDLHVGAGDVPALRLHGRIVALDVPPLASGALDAFLERTAPFEAKARWADGGPADFAQRRGTGSPYRLHAYRAMGRVRLAFRFHEEQIPALDALTLPPIVATFALRNSGLVIFTGPTGSGKTTALAALIDRINTTAERVIVTVEDPVEYVHPAVRSAIAHCEVGVDVPSYAAAVHGFMRADPDVMLVGEMRERATMEAVLTAAETGHLVLSTLHTIDAAQTIDRIIDAFGSEAQGQVRTQLAATLLAVVSLRLVPVRDGSGRVAATEILIGTDAVRAMIRDGKTHQLRNAMATGRTAGMRTLEASLSDLAVRGAISIETARAYANRPGDVRELEQASS